MVSAGLLLFGTVAVLVNLSSELCFFVVAAAQASQRTLTVCLRQGNLDAAIFFPNGFQRWLLAGWLDWST